MFQPGMDTGISRLDSVNCSITVDGTPVPMDRIGPSRLFSLSESQAAGSDGLGPGSGGASESDFKFLRLLV
eukprot:613294-Hanusia_phi.AAC.1